LSLRKWLATIGTIARRFSHLATSCGNMSLRKWEIAAGNLPTCGNLGELSQTLFPPRRVLFSPDGPNTIATSYRGKPQCFSR
ncbi:MAG: hypothetical protein KDD69_13495, partial [Bdellovibrionales bacterium]|nr:hypothetical protein [Bdellovibrionales bacterium]